VYFVKPTDVDTDYYIRGEYEVIGGDLIRSRRENHLSKEIMPSWLSTQTKRQTVMQY